jgi:hypothetical protein
LTSRSLRAGKPSATFASSWIERGRSNILIEQYRRPGVARDPRRGLFHYGYPCGARECPIKQPNHADLDNFNKRSAKPRIEISIRKIVRRRRILASPALWLGSARRSMDRGHLSPNYGKCTPALLARAITLKG